jgi:hypothetical protein
MDNETTVETTDRKKEKRDDQSIIKGAQDCLDSYRDRNSDNIKRAEEAIKFRAGEQWPDAIKRDRESPNQDGGPRPCPVLDKTDQYVRQVVNEERQSRAAIKIRPVDDKGDKKVAEIYTGIIRHIEEASNATSVYCSAGENAIDGGFGYWRVLTEYCDDMSFDQDIRIKRIPNRFSVALGPHSEIDGSDAKEALIWEDIPRSQFKAEYPNAKEVSFEGSSEWSTKDAIRVAEYMCIKPERLTIHLLEDGSIVTDLELNGQLPTKSRSTTINRVKWYKITSAEVLEEQDIVGKYIPVVKVTGNELVMPDGKVRLSGMVEKMMDPQRLHNYAHAGFIEHVALAPRAPWVAEESAVTGYEADYKMANRRNIVLLKYKSRSEGSDNPIPPPQRIQPAGIAPGWQQMLMNTEHGIEGAVGMYGPSVGAKSQEKSGIALQEQKSQGMVGNFHFPDNLSRSIQHTGRILLEWIPKIYDTERVARILGEDGLSDMAYLNPEQQTAVATRKDAMGQEIGSSYNLNVGKYDVTVSSGPSYTAKRQEAAENQIQLIQAKPELLSLIGDIVFSNMDWPQADKIAERLKAMLPAPIKELEMSKDKKPIDLRMASMMKQIQEAGQQLDQKAAALQEAEQNINEQATKVQSDMVKLEAEKKDLAAQARILNSDRQRLKTELELIGLKIVDEVEATLQGQVPPEVVQDISNIIASAQNQISPMRGMNGQPA